MRTTNRALAFTVLGSLLCAFQNTTAQASSITVSGTHVDFSYDSALLGLLGTPTVAGDNLFFSPTAFTASSLNCAGLAMTTATTYIDVQAHTGYDFAGMTLTEQGDYKLRGASGFVAASGKLLAIDRNNPPATGPGASVLLATADDMTLSDNSLHSWSASAHLDLTGSAWNNTDSVRITLDNPIEAYTAPGGCKAAKAGNSHGKHGRKSRSADNNGCGGQLSFIQKNYSGLGVQVFNQPTPPTAVVPLAPSGLFLSSGLLTMLGITQRRRIPCNERR